MKTFNYQMERKKLFKSDGDIQLSNWTKEGFKSDEEIKLSNGRKGTF